MINKRKLFYIVFILFILALAGFCSFIFLPQPEIVNLSPGNKSEGIEAMSEIRIIFSRPVDRNSLIPKISPEVQGEWTYEKPLFEEHLYRELVFKPTYVLMPETDYSVQLNGIKRILNIGSAQNFSFGFLTQELPKVEKVSPENDKNNISPFSEIKVALTKPNSELVNFDFILSPKKEVKAILNSTKDEYTLSVEEGFSQGVKYNLKIIGTFVVEDKNSKEIIFQGDAKELYNGNFKIAPPPKISSFGPTSQSVLTTENIEIVFTDLMDKKSVENNFFITPTVKGSFSWSKDEKTLTFKPTEKLPYQTSFTATIKKGTKNQNNGYLAKDTKFSFKTIGRVFASFYPQNGASGFGVASSIKVYFNQAVNQESAKSKFKIEPAIDGVFSFQGNTMTFNPSSSFDYQKKYKVIVASGIKSVYGLDSNQSFSTSFTTQSQTVKLGVPMDFQDYPLSCEAASLKMALAYKGIYVSEDTIMGYVGTDPKIRNGDIWGDAYNIYVGNISGSQNTTGYGVYWDPIAKAAKVWRSGSEAFTGWSISDLTKELKNGNPVVVWGIYGSGYEDPWHTKDGKYIYAWKGEHARTAIGFVGNYNSPSSIILNDPYDGQIYRSTSSFMSDWNVFGRAGVVVR